VSTGKLIFKPEGDRWVSYFTTDDGDQEVEISSMLLAVALKDLQSRSAFVTLAQQIMGHIIFASCDRQVTWSDMEFKIEGETIQ